MPHRDSNPIRFVENTPIGTFGGRHTNGNAVVCGDGKYCHSFQNGAWVRLPPLQQERTEGSLITQGTDRLLVIGGTSGIFLSVRAAIIRMPE